MPALRSPRKLPHSSDTELYETPTRKRFRPFDDDVASTSSYSPRSSPRKRPRQSQSPRKQPPVDFNLEETLRNIAFNHEDHAAILSLKSIPRDERALRLMIKDLVYSAKQAVFSRFKPRQQKYLETELYMEWLCELEYISEAIDVALKSKIPGTKRRIPSLGRPCFHILYNLVDEFIDEVNAHHDDASPKGSRPHLYPPTMTLVEEARDDTTDSRSEEAVRAAEGYLRNIDSILAEATTRYKRENRSSAAKTLTSISAQEHALVKGCCLLCEQTGFGSTEDDDTGENLMDETRAILQDWKNEYEDCEDQLDASDDDDDEGSSSS